MRLAVALLLTLPILAACGEREKAAPEASTAPATAAPAEVAPVATAAAPANLEAANLMVMKAATLYDQGQPCGIARNAAACR